MKTKKILLALAATSLLAFGAVAPAYAEDPPAGEGTKVQVPEDPDSAGTGETTADPNADEGGMSAPEGSDPPGSAPDTGGEQPK